MYIFSIVGASGAVGREMLRILEEREFPVSELRLFASKKSAGKTIEFRGEEIRIEELDSNRLKGSHIVFLTAGGAISKDIAPIAAEQGAIVIDDSSTFRMDEDTPLVVPEVNGSLLTTIPKRRILPIGNCSGIPLAVAFAPLHRKANIVRAVVSTYQSTSGAGKAAMNELSKQVGDLFNYRPVEAKAFPHQIAFNVIPQIDKFLSDGSTAEEKKIVDEVKKMLDAPQMGISVTAVRVPTFHTHAQSVNLEFEKPLSVEEARAVLKSAEGVEVLDEPKDLEYPMPTLVAGTDPVWVGRIRKDDSRKNALNLWIVSDNLRKGAALNGVQILEKLRANHLL